jgi:4-amino-4-deoxy-L-arabinose transferase-like glycosyltransferase
MQRTLPYHWSETKTKRIWFDLAIIIGLTIILRLSWAILAPSVDPFLKQSPLHGDAAAYDQIARSILAGVGFTEQPPYLSAFWPPLYPAFLSLVYSVAGYNLEAARITQALLGVAVPASVYLIADQHFDRRVARLSAIGIIFYPHLAYFNAWLISESLFMGLLALGMLAINASPDNLRLSRIAMAGLIFGLCALTKPFMLLVMPFLALWLFLGSTQALSRRLLIVSVLAVTMLATILPWTARNYRVYEQVVLISTNGGYTFLGANNPDAWGGHDEGFPPAIPGLNGAEMEDAYYAEAFRWIRSNPDDFSHLLISKYARLLSPLSVASYREDFNIPGRPIVYVLYAAFLLAAFGGAVMAWPQWRQIGFLYALIAGVFVSTGLFYGDARYTLPMAPSLVIFAAIPVDLLFVRHSRK